MPIHNLIQGIGRHFVKSPQDPAQRYKTEGIWRDLSYGQLGEIVREIAAGLIALGVKKGDAISLLSSNRIEWAQVDLGILFASGITVTIYPTSIPREVFYILANSASHFVFIENIGQLEKIISKRPKLPALKRAILIEKDGPSDDFVMGLPKLRLLGRDYLKENPGCLETIAREITAEDIAAIIYTSGTTGPPKGVMLCHRNILFIVTTIPEILGDLSRFKVNLSFLPLSHALERIGGHFLPLFLGKTIAYAEGLDKVAQNFQEIKPDFAISVPRVFEKIYARIHEQLQSASLLKKAVFRWAVRVGQKRVALKQRNIAMPRFLRFRYALADRLVFSKIRALLGGNLKYFVSGGAPLNPRIAEFFFAAGVNVLEGWGATESSAPATLNLPNAFKIGSVGRSLPGVEIKAALDGELLIKGPNVCKGYFQMPEQTAETFDTQGWYHTGDIGKIDSDGYVTITDRKKELIITASGKNISPQNIENKLKLSPYISNAMTYGDQRSYIVALITLDAAKVSTDLKMTEATSAELAERSEVQALIQKAVDSVNADLPTFEQIKAFALLPHDFSVEQDELSPTLKLKRKQITAHYQNRIDGLYSRS